jgi:FAD/FMN-containing dehydrogenase
LVRPGDGAYDAERAVFNAMIDRHPALIARYTGVADVIAAVNFAREECLVVAVRGGGHSVPGYAVCEKTAKSGSGCSKSSALRRRTS